jgi:hypothetical protein
VLVLLLRKSDHPGLAHYIIHTCDTPKLAQQGLPAAKKYAQIASSSPHALHMPGHIFARLGMWPEDISSNLASVAASEKAEAAGIPGTHHMFHAEEFLLYAYLQTGQDGKAKQLVDGINPLADRLDAMAGMDDMKVSGYVRNEFQSSMTWRCRTGSLPQRWFRRHIPAGCLRWLRIGDAVLRMDIFGGLKMRPPT